MGDQVTGGSYDPSLQSLQAQLRGQAVRAAGRTLIAAQIAGARSAKAELAEAFNPFSADRKTESRAFEERRQEIVKKGDFEDITPIEAPEQLDSLAQEHQQRNPELDAELLLNLRNAVMRPGATPEEILAEVLAAFPDPALADEAFEFLIETTFGETLVQVGEARSLLRGRFPREVTAGRNMGAESRTFSSMGLGSPTELRALYLDVTGESQDHNALFEKLSSEHAYDELKEIVEFLLKSLGADLKAEGPSIARGKLYWLVTEVRILQSILGIYSFFQKREALLKRLFHHHGLKMPETLTFEVMAKQFITLVEDRYPSSSKLLRLAKELELEDEIMAQILVYGQYRDAIRQVAPRIYRSLKHRYDLLMALIEALEELEDRLEEEEEGIGEGEGEKEELDKEEKDG